jgi:hypothetical protein
MLDMNLVLWTQILSYIFAIVVNQYKHRWGNGGVMDAMEWKAIPINENISTLQGRPDMTSVLWIQYKVMFLVPKTLISVQHDIMTPNDNGSKEGWTQLNGMDCSKYLLGRTYQPGDTMLARNSVLWLEYKVIKYKVTFLPEKVIISVNGIIISAY